MLKTNTSPRFKILLLKLKAQICKLSHDWYIYCVSTKAGTRNNFIVYRRCTRCFKRETLCQDSNDSKRLRFN